MSFTDLASLGSFVSGIAVLASLVFLYFQLRQLNLQVRQGERNQQASIRHSRITRAVDLQLARADPGLTDAWQHGLENPDAITQTELGQFMNLCRATFFHLEDSFYQHEEGLLNEDAFAVVLGGSRALAGYPGYRLAWKTVRRQYASRFADFVDGIVAQASLDPPAHTPSVDEWKTAFAAESASASH